MADAKGKAVAAEAGGDDNVVEDEVESVGDDTEADDDAATDTFAETVAVADGICTADGDDNDVADVGKLASICSSKSRSFMRH